MASELARKAGYQVVLDMTPKTSATTLASRCRGCRLAEADALSPPAEHC